MKDDLPGEWQFEIIGEKQRQPGRTIRIAEDAAGEPEPQPFFDAVGIAFNYSDGRRIIFPWANIVRADYYPNVEP